MSTESKMRNKIIEEIHDTLDRSIRRAMDNIACLNGLQKLVGSVELAAFQLEDVKSILQVIHRIDPGSIQLKEELGPFMSIGPNGEIRIHDE